MSWEEYASLWPEEIGEIESALSDLKTRAVLIKLLIDGKKDFTSISESLGLSPQSLSYHLKKLMKAGLINNKYLLIDGKRRSIYNITTLGRLYSNSIVELLETYYAPQESSQIKYDTAHTDLLNIHDQFIKFGGITSPIQKPTVENYEAENKRRNTNGKKKKRKK